MKDVTYILIIGYLIYSVIIQLKIIRSQLINRQQKHLNSLLLWIIPFLWGILVLSFIKPSKLGIKTRDKRMTNRFKFSDNWETLTGFGGSTNDHI